MSSEWLSACEVSCGDYPVGIDDLAGTGVIVGFVGGAFIAIAFMVLYYFWAYDPAICSAAPVNPVDDWVLRILKGAHWQMVCYLAWFATVTHLSGLSIMSKHLHGRSWERKSRTILMGILLIVLVVAMVPMAAITISEDDGGEDLILTWNCNATCFFSPQFMANNLHSVSLGLQWGDTDMLTQTAAQFGSAILAIALIILQISTEFYTVEGALNPDPDYLVHGYRTPQGDYRGGTWSFGQILPVFLLIAPVVGFLRSIAPSDSKLQPSSNSEASPLGIGPYPTYQHGNNKGVLTFSTGKDIPHSPAIFNTLTRTRSSGSMIDADADALPQGSLRCLRYLEKSTFGASQLAKNTFVFTTLLVIALMAWFLAVLFLDIGVSYSLSTIISTLPGAVLVGAPLAGFLHLFLATVIFDTTPESSRRRSVYYWAAQVFVDGLLATSIGVGSKQSKALDKAFWPPDKYDEPTNTDELVMFLSPNLYIIFLMTCITMLVMLIATGTHLCTLKSRHAPQDSDQASSLVEDSPEI
ncbi:hypothetical protein J7T55_001119 [Diaporthe amygdali]|uniref:uncharacterized protein n=1 Tax=Phomopsis amygdali TaxID=1214568 RepID=UPI0022FF1B57|nr:uncharacterized protein J7T55_001119 [Diaporthe amygdali]KAJ0120262.1 hypothetical protein J7T55_001119 [Diaporthe amygdali]